MATAAEHIAEDAADFDTHQADQRVLLRAASWADYQRLDQLRGESAAPRLTFLHGALELMSPGFPHETDKKTLARIIEAWADLTGVELTGAGSWTLKDSTRDSLPRPMSAT